MPSPSGSQSLAAQARDTTTDSAIHVGFILGDSAAEGYRGDVQVLVPLLLDVGGREGGGTQRLLSLVHGIPSWHAQGEGCLVGCRCCRCDAVSCQTNILCHCMHHARRISSRVLACCSCEVDPARQADSICNFHCIIHQGVSSISKCPARFSNVGLGYKMVFLLPDTLSDLPLESGC